MDKTISIEEKKSFANIVKKFSFKKSERIHKTKDFQNIYNKGKIYRSAHLTIFVLNRGKIQKIPDVRVGIIIPRKVGKATKRNKLKRRIREIFRLNKHLIVPGHDILIYAKKSATELSFLELKQDVLELFRKGKIYSG